MHIQPEKIGQLLARRIAQEPLSPEEEAYLNAWASLSRRNRAMIDHLREDNFLSEVSSQDLHAQQQESWHLIIARLCESTAPLLRRRSPRIRLMALSASIAAVVAAIYVGIALTPNHARQVSDYTLLPADTLHPRSSYIIFSTGERIQLDSVYSGPLPTPANDAIKLTPQRDVSYFSAHSLLYNKVVAGAGRQYHLILSDSSEVWLNAQSTIRFPVSFSESERRVELTGQAYFQVHRDPQRPFLVSTAPLAGEDTGLTIKVLGTAFDCKAYPGDTTMVTTLLEGTINISRNGPGLTIAGTKEAHYFVGTNKIHLEPVLHYVDWRNPKYFDFETTRLYLVLEQLSRWYNVKIHCPDAVMRFWAVTAKIRKDRPLDDVLHALATGIRAHYHRQNDSIVIDGDIPR